MNLFEAAHLADSLLKQHGLSDWTFRFDHARRRFGSCRPTLRQITLSRTLTKLNGLEEVRDTILHEIAHALAPKDGHGEQWKTACRRIGARPVRCYTNEQVVSPSRPQARYAIGCTKCGWWVDRRRVTRRILVCKICREPVLYRENTSQELFAIERVGKTLRIRKISDVPIDKIA